MKKLMRTWMPNRKTILLNRFQENHLLGSESLCSKNMRIGNGLLIKKVSVCLVAATLISSQIFASYSSTVYAETPNSSQTGDIQTINTDTRHSYAAYIEKYKDAVRPDLVIEIAGKDYTKATGSVSLLEEYEEDTGTSVRCDEESSISWNLDVPETGLYNIGIEYYPVDGKGGTIERELLIDEKLPFDSAQSITFGRTWINSSEPQKDKNDNEYRPQQEEKKGWMNMTVSGYSDYEDNSFCFYFSQGHHKITLNAIAEPLVIRKIILFNEKELISYKQYIAKYEHTVPSQSFLIEAENIFEKSDATLYALNDRSSPDTTPNSISKIRLNTIGGSNWSSPGQWIKWEVDVPESGLYQIGFRARQDYNEGVYSCRKLYIDDEIPFNEAKNITFTYDTRWQMKRLGDENPYLFYLTKGRHTLKLEVTLGDIAHILQKLDQVTFDLNYIYRKILMITGMFPDPNRDYRLDVELPECMTVFKESSERLKEVKQGLLDLMGSKGSNYASVEKLELMINTFLKNPNTIPARMETFRSNISENAAWVLTAGEQPLLLDKIYILPENAELPKADAGFFEKFVYGFQAFMYSFFEDYSSISTSNSEEGSRQVTLWMGSAISTVSGAVSYTTVGNSGRDQAQVLKTLVDNYFTPKTNINVEIKLVDTSALLPAVAANVGPDVAIGQEKTTPVNYALRSALYDLSTFQDLPETLKQYTPSAYEAYKIDDSLYALPETQTFPMMFYREDILEELNIAVPETWDDLQDAISIFQRNYLEVGFPALANNDLSIYNTLITQMGGQIYNDDNSRTAYSTPIGIEAFVKWSDFYTKYKVPQKMDFLTRFRTGEVPIVISPYSFYNSLAISAPEIRGLWNFTLVPGTRKDDGTVDHSVVSEGTGAIMFANARDKEASWEFLKWWTGEEAQANFGRELEYLQGPAARWATANIAAANKLSWDTETLKTINKQRNAAVGVPEVPGGYIINRYIGNAIRLVINNGGNPREMLLDWDLKINNEIILKRQEFGFE